MQQMVQYRNLILAFFLFQTVILHNITAQDADGTLFYWVSDKTGTTDEFLKKYAPENRPDCPHYLARVDGLSLQRGAAVALGNANRDNTANWQGFKSFVGDSSKLLGAMNSGLMNKSWEFATRAEWKKNWNGDVGLISSFKNAGVKKVVMFMQSPLSKGDAGTFNPNLIKDTQPNGGATLAQRILDCVEYADFVEATKPAGIEVTYGLIDAFPAKTLFTPDVYHKAYVDLVKAFQAKGYVLEEIQVDMKTQTVKNSANALVNACKRAYTEILQQTGQKVRMTWYTWNGGVATSLEANNLIRTALQNIANHPDRVYVQGLLLDGNNEDRSGIVDLIPQNQSETYTITARLNESFSILEKLGTLNPTSKGDPILGTNNGSVDVTVPKPKPDNLSVKVVSPTELALSWTDNILNETGFIIERTSENESDWVKIDSTLNNITGYTDKNLNDFELYSYRLRAKYVGDTLSDATEPVFGRPSRLVHPVLPQPWQSASMGETNVAMGSSSYFASDTFTVDAGDGDFWDVADRGHFVYQSLTGDGSIVAQLTDFDHVQSFSMAGVMMRESVQPGSKFAAMLMMSVDGPIFRERVAADGAVNQRPYGKTGEKAPYWVKLTRTGNSFSGYISPDATTWKLIRSADVAMPQQVLVGLTASSHTTASNGIYRFAGVTVDGGDTPVKQYGQMMTTVYANRAQDKLVIFSSTNTIETVGVYSIHGKLLDLKKIASNTATLSTSGLSGAYFVVVTSNGKQEMHKVVL
jgi:regulation of enolase protein 1 (concanavalin A-like superfamily)